MSVTPESPTPLYQGGADFERLTPALLAGFALDLSSQSQCKAGYPLGWPHYCLRLTRPALQAAIHYGKDELWALIDYTLAMGYVMNCKGWLVTHLASIRGPFRTHYEVISQPIRNSYAAPNPLRHGLLWFRVACEVQV